MGLGRRKQTLDDGGAWVFNRMADVYDARPAYPIALIEAVADLAGSAPVLDVGAGVGHLALPLAARGMRVTAIEPAQAMLARLRALADRDGLSLHTVHAQAECLPLESSHYGLATIADALHFLDAERAGLELGRVLAPGGQLALVTCEFADSPFMRGVVACMEEAAPRRPRDVTPSVAQLSALAQVSLSREHRFHDETRVDEARLERILRSISFIGPAMNPQRFAAFRARVLALPGERRWGRTLHLRIGTRRGG